MKRRVVILVVALVLGGIAAVLAARYIEGARSRVQFESGTVDVFVATEDIPRGTRAEDLLAKKLVALRSYPREVVSSGAVSSMRTLEGQVLSVPLAKGEQITQARFQYPSEAGLAYSVPKDYVAVSFPVDEGESVAGLLKPQDRVVLVASFPKNAARAEGVSRIVVRGAVVLAVGTKVGAESETADQSKQSGLLGGRSTTQEEAPPTVTVAVSPSDVERVVFAQEKGNIWVALLPADTQAVPPTTGRTMGTVFKW
jgi:pilus assembly protein CpaB